MTDRALTSPVTRRRHTRPAVDLCLRASVACGQAEQLRVRTVRSLDQSALLRAERGALLSGAPERSAALRDQVRRAEERVANLELALLTNRRIGIAVGILMRGLPATEEQAWGVLKSVSMRANVKIRDVAEQVIRTGAV